MSLGFNQLPKNPEEKELVYFLPGGFYAMSDLIKTIGDIKDPALYTEEMSRIATLFKIKSQDIKKKLGTDFASHTDTVKKARAVIESKVNKELILKHISDYFESQL